MRLMAKSTSKETFFAANKQMATKLAEKEMEEEMKKEQITEVRIEQSRMIKIRILR